MQYPHPLSRKLFVAVMSLHIIFSPLYFIPETYTEDAPKVLIGGLALTYVLLAGSALYGFFKKMTWAWVPIVIIYALSVIEVFALSKYELNPNTFLDLYVETFGAALSLALYGRAIRTGETAIHKKVGLLKRDIWHWLMIFFIPVIGTFISFWILGRDNVYTRTKGEKKLYAPSSRLVLIAIAVLIFIRFSLLMLMFS